MKNNNFTNKIALKISTFAFLAFAAFGLFSPTAHAEIIVRTGSVSNITYGGANLTGYLTEQSLPATAWFEWGTDINNLSTITTPNYYNSLSNTLTASLTGLSSDTVYYFRAVAQNTTGKSYGNILYFRTTYYPYNNNNDVQYYNGAQPVVTTLPASNITSESATFSGMVNGNGLSTNAWFEWGTNKNFSNSTTQNYYKNGTDVYNIIMTGLKPSMAYYYRAVAQNTKGRVFGDTLSFSTAAPLPYANTQSYYPNTYTPPVTEKPRTVIIYKTAPASNTVNTQPVYAPIYNNIPSNNYAAPAPITNVQTTSNIGAAAIGASFLPGSLLGWLVLIVLILCLMLITQNLLMPQTVQVDHGNSHH